MNESLFADHGLDYFNKEENNFDKHIVRKGIFIEDEDDGLEEILLTLCGKFKWNESEPNLGKFDHDWFKEWLQSDGCKTCYEVLIFGETDF